MADNTKDKVQSAAGHPRNSFAHDSEVELGADLIRRKNFVWNFGGAFMLALLCIYGSIVQS